MTEVKEGLLGCDTVCSSGIWNHVPSNEASHLRIPAFILTVKAAWQRRYYFTCRTRCCGKQCLIQRTTYSVSDSVSSTGSELRNSGPSATNSGTLCSFSAYDSSRLTVAATADTFEPTEHKSYHTPQSEALKQAAWCWPSVWVTMFSEGFGSTMLLTRVRNISTNSPVWSIPSHFGLHLTLTCHHWSLSSRPAPIQAQLFSCSFLQRP